MARAFLVDDEVAGPGLFFERLDELAEFELGDDEVDAGVLVGGLVGGAGDDERRAGLVDEDGVDLVDDAVVLAALDHVVEVELHVVAEVVKAELVVGAVGDVGGVGVASLLVGEIVDDDADREAEEAVDLAHPLGVALGEVVVDGDDVDAAAGEGVEVAGKGGDEGFAFAGLHFGDLAGVEDHAADELDVEVTHVDGAAGGFANDGEGLGHEVVEGGFFGGVDGVANLGRARFDWVGGDVDLRYGVSNALAELGGFGAELLVRERLDGGLEGVDGLDGGEEALDGAFVAGAEDLGEDFIEHGVILFRRGRARRTRVGGEGSSGGIA